MEPTRSSVVEHAGGLVLHLFGGPYLTDDEVRIEIPEGAKRLVAFIALRHRSIERRHVAGTLWPDAVEARAAGNLRSALWRLRTAGIRLIEVDGSVLRLVADVTIDAQDLLDRSARLVDGAVVDADLIVTAAWLDGLDLLPGWYDDWVLIERERVRQRTLHTLELLSAILGRMGRFTDAVDVALMAVSADPLRESAQRALIAAHLVEGNLVEARRVFFLYRALVHCELGAAPSAAMRGMLWSGDHEGPSHAGGRIRLAR